MRLVQSSTGKVRTYVLSECYTTRIHFKKRVGNNSLEKPPCTGRMCIRIHIAGLHSSFVEAHTFPAHGGTASQHKEKHSEDCIVLYKKTTVCVYVRHILLCMANETRCSQCTFTGITVGSQ